LVARLIKPRNSHILPVDPLVLLHIHLNHQAISGLFKLIFLADQNFRNIEQQQAKLATTLRNTGLCGFTYQSHQTTNTNLLANLASIKEDSL
jgi:hypothetical protein